MLSFISYPPIREIHDSKLGSVLSDINSHLNNPNSFDDKSLITSSHEKAHLIASDLRNKYPGKGGFYLLNNKAAILHNPPNTTIEDVRRAVPLNLRGISFSLYLVAAQRDWGTFPIYLADELNSYILGSKCGLEVGEEFASEIQQAIEFCLYLSVLAELSKDKGVLEFQRYQLKVALEIQSTKPSRGASIYLQKWVADSAYKKYLQSSLGEYGNKDFL